jgi:hypothetical protein
MRASLLLIFQGALLANDSYLGTDAGNIYPQKSTNIQMLKEVVNINLEKEGGMVHCRFWFLNRGISDTIFVGFPDFYINPAQTSEPAKNFKAWVNGNPARVQRDSLNEIVDSDDTAKSSWYYWKAYFPKDDTTIIENQYYGVWGGSYCEKRFSYIIGTGNKWNGPILNGRVVFHHGSLLSSLFVANNFLLEPGDLRPKHYEDSTVYEFSNYRPKDNERLDLWISSYWKNGDSTNCPGYFIPTDRLKQKDEMINELYARQGHIFKSKTLQAKYSSKAWYKPDKTLSLSDLPKNIQYYIMNLKSGKNKLMSR